jgi:hypothetical protein
MPWTNPPDPRGKQRKSATAALQRSPVAQRLVSATRCTKTARSQGETKETRDCGVAALVRSAVARKRCAVRLAFTDFRE